VRAVAQQYVQAGFHSGYADGETNKTKSEKTERKAFSRSLEKAKEEGRIMHQRDDNDTVMIWFTPRGEKR
jgi:hypothetical protein